MNKIDISSLTLSELELFLSSLSTEKYRAAQIFEWLHKKLALSFDEMSSLPKDLRKTLAETAAVSNANIVKKLHSSKDGTVKYLFDINGALIESVLMRYEFGASACLSTQAGCRMGCAFCASTVGGLERNLTAGEILAQLYAIQRDIGLDRISGAVLMGSGEPFDNFDNTMKFLELVTHEKGINIGQRHITVSTCGIVPRILDFAERDTQVNLAVSLHAPNDEIRRTLMPVAKKYSVDELLHACSTYARRTNRRVTYEYALISGVNDGLSHAAELGARLRAKPAHGAALAHVNLIPVNEVAEKNFTKTNRAVAAAFCEKLKTFGIEATIRRELGGDINAACGQLRNAAIRG